MKPLELKVARIGNSRGVRIPAATLERYRIGESVVMEERSDGILLRSLGRTEPKLSWRTLRAPWPQRGRIGTSGTRLPSTVWTTHFGIEPGNYHDVIPEDQRRKFLDDPEFNALFRRRCPPLTSRVAASQRNAV